MSNYQNNFNNQKSQYKKHYCGSGKERGNYGIVSARIYLDQAKPFIKVDDKGRHYLDFDCGKRKEADQFGFTHAVWISEKIVEEPQPQPFDIGDAPF